MRPFTLLTVIRLLTILGASAALSPVVAQPWRVLVISDVPETREINYQQSAAAFTFLRQEFASPEAMLGEDFVIDQVGWLEAPAYLKRLKDYDALILWETPARITDSRDRDPHYRDIAVISDQAAGEIAQWVKNGGALLVAGGLTNYGEGYESSLNSRSLGSSNYRDPNERIYYGLAGTPLEDILPVSFEDDTITLQELPDSDRPLASSNDPIWNQIDITVWPLDAYHLATARPEAEVLAQTASGQPLVTRMVAGEGRVVSVLAAPSGNGIFVRDHHGRNPRWEGEPVLWDRLIRWTLNSPYSPDDEGQATERYDELLVLENAYPLAWLQYAYPYGVHEITDTLPRNMVAEKFRYLRELNFNFLMLSFFTTLGEMGHEFTPEGLRTRVGAYDAALEKENLWGVMRTLFAEGIEYTDHPEEEWVQITQPSGKTARHYGRPNPCPYSPVAREYSEDQARRYGEVMRDFPRFRGAFWSDEWGWILGYRNPYEGGQGVASYSPWVNEMYEEKTGRPVPDPVYRELGYVAPEDDPWLLWVQEVRQDAFGDYNEIVFNAIRENRPDFIGANYPGGFEGNLPLMIEEHYLDCWRSSELLSFERSDTRINWVKGTKGVAPDYWALIGIFRMPEDKSMYPETLRLTVGATLGGGAKGILLWNAVNLWVPYFQHPGRHSLADEARDLGAYLKDYGPMFLQLERPTSPYWMLTGWFWVNSFDNYLFLPPDNPEGYNKETPWRMIQVSDLSVPALMRAGLPMEIVTEKQLMSDELFEREAVFLPALPYAREGMMENLATFIERGGTVYQDESAVVKVPGATILPVNFAAWHEDISAGKRPTAYPTEKNYRAQRAMVEAHLEEIIPVIQQKVPEVARQEVSLSNTKSAHSWLEHGEARYLFLYNTDYDQPNELTVSLKGEPAAIYPIGQLGSLKTVKATDSVSWQLRLPAGGWMAYAMTPAAVDKLTVNTAAVEGTDLKIMAKVLDADDKPINAAVPLACKIMLKDGSSRELALATRHGILDVSLPIEELPSAPVAVHLTERFTGSSAQQSVQ